MRTCTRLCGWGATALLAARCRPRLALHSGCCGGHRDDLLIQNYLTGLCGGDVTPTVIDEILADLRARESAGDPVWMGIDSGEETVQ